MKQHALDVRNCDDLMMNFLVTKYYPYFIPDFVDPNSSTSFVLKDGPKAVSQGKAHYLVRDECVKKYSEIVGMIPMWNNLKNMSTIQKDFWTFPKELRNRMV